MSESGEGFGGFQDDTVQFLRDLALNNDRDWFTANRRRYEAHVIEPAKAFVEAAGALLQQISPSIRYEARVDGSIFRLTRDVRFGKDKTPYKTHLDLWFWEGEGRGWDNPAFFFRLTAETLILGAGVHQFGPRLLPAYREAVVDPVEGKALSDALAAVEHAGPYQLGGDQYRRVPAGYSADHERAELLKHKGLYLGLEGPLPSTAFTRKLVDYCLGHYRNLAPIHTWLTRLAARVGGG
jgi:uncharacterized protein (TIGR02453 family)